MKFRSAVDSWFYLLVIGIPLAVLGAGLASMPFPTTAETLVFFAVVVFTMGLPAWLLLSTHYEVADGRLTIRSGPMRIRIDLEDIESVQPSRSILASPALSLDRLKIRYGGGKSVLVSPERRKEFLDAIGHRPAT